MSLRVLLAALVLAAAPSLAAQTLQRDAAPVQTALRYVEAQGPALGLSRADTEAPLVTDAYLDEATGIGHVYLRQQVGGIEVADANLNVTLGRTGEVVYMTGAFYAQAAARTNTAAPSLTAEAAVARDAALTGEAVPTAFRATEGTGRGVTFAPDGRSDQPVTARLVYQPMEGGQFRLAWETLFYPTGSPHVWLVRVDAQSGAELARYDLVVTDTWGEALHEAQESVGPWLFSDAVASAPLAANASPAMVGSYRVYAMPVESPIHSTPASPADGRTLVANPDVAGGIASPFGWHDTNGAAGAEFTITRGNNAYAYTDTDGNNSPDAGSAPDGGAGLAFDFTLDLTQAPSTYRPAAVTNAFYWSNIIHDVTYQYGFTEAAGNYQTNNYGRGGLGNDALNAEVQDGSDTDNARFFPAVDGSVNRMEMYLWPTPNPDRDGDLDAGVMTHEYTHGISNRLTGGPATVSCLNNGEQMGEGWSDYYGVMLTMRTGDTRTTNRGVGNYVLNLPTTGPGIRPAPYNTNFAVNDYTYQRTRTAAVPHGVGFIWATILWEATWDMIDAHGFSADIYNAAGTAGNQMMLRLVNEAMKVQSCSPGFVD
ncbi:MAG TPA: M36 family metallopeptidase, partial [Rhodothermales bacterium]|nr:M36 family metallopeptidase [Rhodothermales bacterium]